MVLARSLIVKGPQVLCGDMLSAIWVIVDAAPRRRSTRRYRAAHISCWGSRHFDAWNRSRLESSPPVQTCAASAARIRRWLVRVFQSLA